MAFQMEMYWDNDPVQGDTGRDQRIADGLEVAALLSDADDDHQSDVSEQEPDYYNPQTKEFAAGKNKRSKLRVAGGVAPTAKPVTADYDSDDGRIIELKQLGHADEYVAAKLVEEGRIRYVGKTIGSRYLRLRKVLDDKEDEKLDDELTDWHVGEDDKLNPIVKALKQKMDKQIEKMEMRMWKDVSTFFAGQIGGKKKYTHKACRERYEAILNGTELPPIEFDSDPEGRRKLREARIHAAKAARVAAADKAVAIEALKKSKTIERKRAIAEANQKKVTFQLKKIAEKKERLRIRYERIANRELAKKTRQRILNHMRMERDWEMEKNRREKEIFTKIMGVDMNGKPAGRSGRNKNKYDSDEESEAIDDLESDEEEADFTDAEEADDADDESEDENIDPDLEDYSINDDSVLIDSGVVSPAAAVVKVPTSGRSRPKRKSANIDEVLGGDDDDFSPPTKKMRTPTTTSTGKKRPTHKSASNIKKQPATRAGKKITPAKKKKSPAMTDGSNAVVSEDTLFNPRSIMSRAELEDLCRARDIPRHSFEEDSHPELVARLNAIDFAIKNAELDDLLRSACELVGGTKAEKAERLQKFDASGSFAGGMGLDSHDIDHMRKYEGFKGEFKYLLDDAEHTAARHMPVENGGADW